MNIILAPENNNKHLAKFNIASILYAEYFLSKSNKNIKHGKHLPTHPLLTMDSIYASHCQNIEKNKYFQLNNRKISAAAQ